MGTTRVLMVKNDMKWCWHTNHYKARSKSKTQVSLNPAQLPHLLEEEEEAVVEEACLASQVVAHPRSLGHTGKIEAPTRPLMARPPHMWQSNMLL